jgi:ketosteroid isomerase-like protein
VYDALGPLDGRLDGSARSVSLRRGDRARFSSLVVTPSEGVRLRRVDDVAIASTTFQVEAQGRDGRVGTSSGRTSLVLEHRGRSWLIVHEHTSIPLMEEWLGGAEVPPVAEDIFAAVPRDTEFQAIVDDYPRRWARVARRMLLARKRRCVTETGDDVVIWDPSSRRVDWMERGRGSPRCDGSARAAHEQAKPRRRARGVTAISRGPRSVSTVRATRRDGVVPARRASDRRLPETRQHRRIVHEHASMPLIPKAHPARATMSSSRAPTRTTRGIPKLPQVSRGVTDGRLVPSARSSRRSHGVDVRRWSAKDGRVDWDRALDFYAPDDGLCFIDAIASRTCSNRKQLRAAYDARQPVKLSPHDDLKVFRRGDVVWTTNAQDLVLRDANGEETRVARVQTAIWELRNGRWLIVHEHVSKL